VASAPPELIVWPVFAVAVRVLTNAPAVTLQMATITPSMSGLGGMVTAAVDGAAVINREPPYWRVLVLFGVVFAEVPPMVNAPAIVIGRLLEAPRYA
jgi:hypothetical protein